MHQCQWHGHDNRTDMAHGSAPPIVARGTVVICITTSARDAKAWAPRDQWPDANLGTNRCWSVRSCEPEHRGLLQRLVLFGAKRRTSMHSNTALGFAKVTLGLFNAMVAAAAAPYFSFAHKCVEGACLRSHPACVPTPRYVRAGRFQTTLTRPTRMLSAAPCALIPCAHGTTHDQSWSLCCGPQLLLCRSAELRDRR